MTAQFGTSAKYGRPQGGGETGISPLEIGLRTKIV